MNTFGAPVLAVEDYTITELECNKECPMVTVVLPFPRHGQNNL